MIVIPIGEVLAPGRIQAVAACLQDGGVIAHPTDTLYGLGGDFFSPAARARIDAMKGRGGQPYSAAVGSLDKLESLVAEIPPVFHDRLRRLLPGKFTFLFKPNPAIDPGLLKNSGRIGIRLPALRPLLRLLQALDAAWISTSANRSGRPPLQDPRRIAREFPELDILIDGGVLPPSRGSTVVDLTVSPPRIVRCGADLDSIAAALGGGPPRSTHSRSLTSRGEKLK